jgi:hypothetical protein
MRRFAPILVVLALALAPRSASAGACARPGWTVSLVPTGQIAVDGGLLALLGSQYGAAFDPQPQPAQLARPDGAMTMTPRPIAPGLWRLMPDQAPALGTWTLDGETPRSIEVIAAPAPIAAPAASVSIEEGRARGPRYTTYYRNVRARLRRAPPPGTFGIIVENNGTPVLFAQTQEGSRDVMLFATPGRCGVAIPGAQPPSAGDRIVLRYVDVTGRISEPSRPIRVTRAPRGQGNPLLGI